MNDVGPSTERAWKLGQIAALTSLAVTASTFAFANVMAAPLLPEIQAEFGRGPAFGGLVFNISLATAGAATPLVVLAAGRVGNKAMIVFILAAFVVASLIIGLGPSDVSLVGGRALWGLAGALLPCSYALGRTIFEGRSVIIATATISGLVGTSGGLGLVAVATFGGSYRTVALTWWLGAGLVALALVVTFIPRDEPPVAAVASTRGMATTRGVATTSLSVLLILLPLLYVRAVLDRPIVGVASIALGVGLLAFTRTSREMLAPNPTVTAANIMNVLGIAGFFSIFVAVPAIVLNANPVRIVDDDLAATALVLLLPSLAAFAGSQLSGRLIRNRAAGSSGSRIVTAAGLIAATGLVIASLAPSNPFTLLGGLTLVGLGAGGAFNGIVETVSRSGPVAARTGTLVAGRYIGGALGGATVAMVLEIGEPRIGTLDAISLSFMVMAALQVLGTIVWTWRADSPGTSCDDEPSMLHPWFRT